MKVLDLFSGIGGFSLGLERAGFETVAFCEIEPFCRRVLNKHWPAVPIYEDIRELTGDTLRRDGIDVDVICGGFPCQDISFAGHGAGIEGERSGLWKEYARLISDLRPRWVIVENVAALLNNGLGTVLSDLAALGYDAQWDCIPASAVGAPHRRDRIWIIAHANGDTGDQGRSCDAQQGKGRRKPDRSPVCNDVSNASGARLQIPRKKPAGKNRQQSRRPAAAGHWWSAEPDVDRVAHGVPQRVDRIKALGNAVVPQIPELIGNAIISAEKAKLQQA